MPINTKAPITIPAKEFTKHWVTVVEISSPSPTEEAIATCRLVPFNDDGAMAPDHTEVLIVRNIMLKSQDPESNIAKAMYFLLAAINEEYQDA
jgi:hypothetical protein